MLYHKCEKESTETSPNSSRNKKRRPTASLFLRRGWDFVSSVARSALSPRANGRLAPPPKPGFSKSKTICFLKYPSNPYLHIKNFTPNGVKFFMRRGWALRYLNSPPAFGGSLSRKPSGFRELSSASENSRFHPFPFKFQPTYKIYYSNGVINFYAERLGFLLLRRSQRLIATGERQARSSSEARVFKKQNYLLFEIPFKSLPSYKKFHPKWGEIFYAERLGASLFELAPRLRRVAFTKTFGFS
jgi:hypothetical protein